VGRSQNGRKSTVEWLWGAFLRTPRRRNTAATTRDSSPMGFVALLRSFGRTPRAAVGALSGIWTRRIVDRVYGLTVSTRLVVLAAPLVAITLGALSPSGAGTASGASRYRIVFGSACYGEMRAYSIHPDGSGLAQLLSRDRKLTPLAVSGDGSTIAYRTGAAHWYPSYLDYSSGAIYVSRADGTGLHRVARSGSRPALSRNGRQLAFVKRGAIWIVGRDGRGLRRVTSGPLDNDPDWSPDGNALVFRHTATSAIVVQPFRGHRRELVPREGQSPQWSPDGRWIAYIAYSGPGGLYVARSDGRGRRGIGLDTRAFSWSPNSRRLALVSPDGLAIIGVDGRGLRRLRLGRRTELEDLRWSPDGRQLAFVDSFDQPPQLLAVGSDGRGLRRLTSACSNTLVGWTHLASPLAPPSERVVAGGTVATRDTVGALSADGVRVAFFVRSSPTDCEHLDVWAPGDSSLQRLERGATPCRAEVGYVGAIELALAGARVAWADWNPGSMGSGSCWSALGSASLGESRPLFLGITFAGCKPTKLYHLRANGDLLVFNDGSRLVRIGTGREKCIGGLLGGASICATLRRGAHACCVDSVSGGLIAIRERGAVAVLDEQGKLVRVFPFPPADVSAARLDGDRLIVWRSGRLELYHVTTGALELSRPLPSGYRLADVDGGIAVLLGSQTIMLLRLGDGRSLTLKPGRGPLLANLEPPGLYYSYTARGGGGRVIFLPRSDLVRQLDQGSEPAIAGVGWISRRLRNSRTRT
jgi:hypothetical protein